MKQGHVPCSVNNAPEQSVVAKGSIMDSNIMVILSARESVDGPWFIAISPEGEFPSFYYDPNRGIPSWDGIKYETGLDEYTVYMRERIDSNESMLNGMMCISLTVLDNRVDWENKRLNAKAFRRAVTRPLLGDQLRRCSFVPLEGFTSSLPVTMEAIRLLQESLQANAVYYSASH